MRQLEFEFQYTLTGEQMYSRQAVQYRLGRVKATLYWCDYEKVYKAVELTREDADELH